jgi:hypothetical protein
LQRKLCLELLTLILLWLPELKPMTQSDWA